MPLAMEGGFRISLVLWPLLALSIAYFDHPHKGHIWSLAQASFPLQALQDVASTVWKHQENIRIWVRLFHCTDYRIMTKLLCRWWWWWWWWWYEYAAYQTMFISYTVVFSLILGWWQLHNVTLFGLKKMLTGQNCLRTMISPVSSPSFLDAIDSATIVRAGNHDFA